jgi:hypothetical protein
MTPLTGGGFNTVREWSADGRQVLYRTVDSAGATLRWRLGARR